MDHGTYSVGELEVTTLQGWFEAGMCPWRRCSTTRLWQQRGQPCKKSQECMQGAN